MDEERYPALPWQGWKIVKRLGRGGYGSVYLAQRNSAGVMEDAAVKVISFPKNEEDIEADFTDGYDLVSVRNKYKNMLHRYVDGIRSCWHLKGRPILSAAMILKQNRIKTELDGMFLSVWNC